MPRKKNSEEPAAVVTSAEIVPINDQIQHATVRETRDPWGVELVSDARHVLAAGCGDCDELVVLLCSLCAVCGIATRFVAVGPTPDEFTHVYCEAQNEDGQWIALDPTNPQAEPGWAVPSSPAFAFRLEYSVF